MPTSTFDIRRATDADFDAIWTIFHEVIQAGTFYAFAAETSKAATRQLWMLAPTATYVAIRNGTILGSYYIKPNQPGRGAHICNAGYMVSGHARGQGIGRAMCAHSLVEAKKLGFQAMQYNLVVSTNASAIKLWESFGFARVGRLPKAFDHAELGLVDALVMYKCL